MLKSGQIDFSKNRIANTSNQNSPKEDESTQEEQKLNSVIKEMQKVLIQVKPVALFDLAPDELTVDLNKVNIITREFLGGVYIKSILITEITDIEVETATFSTIKFIEAHNKEITTVSNLKYTDADKVRNIVQGIKVAENNSIDLTKIELEKLPEKLEKLGQGVF